jgi:hypothetical protein
MKTSQQEISNICDEIKNMLLDKNMKYGDSALNPVRVMSKSSPEEQILVRIDDKLSRLSKGDLTNDDEDVINDLIGYFILLKIARNRAKPDKIAFDMSSIIYGGSTDTISLDTINLSSYNPETPNFRY